MFVAYLLFWQLMITSVYFDDDFEISKDDAFDKISYAISEILALEPARYHRNFLVKVID